MLGYNEKDGRGVLYRCQWGDGRSKRKGWKWDEAVVTGDPKAIVDISDPDFR